MFPLLVQELKIQQRASQTKTPAPTAFGGSDNKESACSAGDPGLIPALGRSSDEGKDNPLQYSCLGNPMDRRSLVVHSMVLQKSQSRLKK